MNTQHTPGPWEQKIQICELWFICTVYGTEQGWIEIHAPNGSDTEDHRAESTANARLIAAAPDLLEALKSTADLLQVWIDGAPPYDEAKNDREVLAKARAAIAKAEGVKA